MTINAHKMFHELKPFLDKYQIWVVNWEMGKRHRKVWVTDGETTAMIVVSVSPSDHRAFYNIAKSARNAIREAR